MQGSVTLQAVGLVLALNAKIDRATLTEASEWVVEVVSQFVASEAARVAALETVGEIALLEDLVPVDTDLSIAGGEEILAVSAELQFVAGRVQSLQQVELAIDHAEDVGAFIRSHSH